MYTHLEIMEPGQAERIFTALTQVTTCTMIGWDEQFTWEQNEGPEPIPEEYSVKYLPEVDQILIDKWLFITNDDEGYDTIAGLTEFHSLDLTQGQHHAN
jgi:hypothetical protein